MQLPKTAFHQLKINCDSYDKIISGIKTFDVRLNDRNFQVGDLIQFVKFDIKTKQIKDEAAFFIITCIDNDIDQIHEGLYIGYCVIGFMKLNY